MNCLKQQTQTLQKSDPAGVCSHYIAFINTQEETALLGNIKHGKIISAKRKTFYVFNILHVHSLNQDHVLHNSVL